MTIDEIRDELLQLNNSVADLQRSLSETYGEELPQEPATLSRGLYFKTDTDLFTAEEKDLNERLRDTITVSLRLTQELSNEATSISRALHNKEQYYSTIDEEIENAEADTPQSEDLSKIYISSEQRYTYTYSSSKLDTLHRETEDALQQAQTLSETLGTLSRALQNVACNRYFDRLTYKGRSRENDKLRAINAEVDAIANGADTRTTDGEPIRVGGFYIFDSRAEAPNLNNNQVSKVLDALQAVNLICYYNNGYYELHYSTILPTNTQLSAEEQRAFIRETVQPCFKSHLEALKAIRRPTKDAEQSIAEAVEKLYKEVALLREAGSDEQETSLIVRSSPVPHLNYPMTAITRELYSGTYSPVTNKPVKMFSKGNDNKPVYMYYSTSLADVEGVTGAENLSLEEEGICNAIYSLFKAGNRYVTNQMIKDTRRGGKGKSKTRITDKEDARYTNFIETAKYIKIRIDQREYAKERGLPHEQFEDILLDVAKVYNVNINGTVVEWCWYIKQAPIINVHAELIGQSLSLPMQLANVDVRAEFYPLRDYLIQEIYRIKSDKLNTETPAEKALREEAEAKKKAEAVANGKTYKPKRRIQHPVILFSTIYSRLYDNPDLRTKKTIQKETLKMLEHWKKYGFIKDYKPQVEGVNRKSTSKSRANKSYTLLDAVEIDVTKSELLEE